MKELVIAIDGPAGAGKSTIAKLVAAELGYIYIDTGAMYRAVAWKTLQTATSASDTEKIAVLTENLQIKLTNDNGQVGVLVDGVDVGEAIRTPEISRLVPVVAAIPGVRSVLLQRQREMAVKGGVVMDGRDIGTAVLPDAEVKVFLTASIEERARRRWLELKNKGFEVSLVELQAEIAARDKQDYERETAPLCQAADAELLDTTGLTIEGVTAAILKIVERRGNGV